MVPQGGVGRIFEGRHATCIILADVRHVFGVVLVL